MKDWLIFSLGGLLIVALFSYFLLSILETALALCFLALFSFGAYRYSKNKRGCFAGEK